MSNATIDDEERGEGVFDSLVRLDAILVPFSISSCSLFGRWFVIMPT